MILKLMCSGFRRLPSVLALLLVSIACVPPCLAAPTTLDSDDLWRAAAEGDAEQVKDCLEAGVDVDAKNPYGVTALLLAAEHGKTDVAKQLLAAGADPGTKDRFYGSTPIGWAIARKQYDLITALVKSNAPDAGRALTESVYRKDAVVMNAILDAETLSVDAILWAAQRAQLLEHSKLVERLREALPDDASDTEFENPDPVEAYEGFYRGSNGETLQMQAKGDSLWVKPNRKAGLQRLSHFSPCTFGRGMTTVVFSSNAEGAFNTFRRESRSEVVTFEKQPDMTELPELDLDADASDNDEALRADTTPDDFVFAEMPWASFRGHLSRGVSMDSAPTSWDVETGDNVAWKAPIAGLANSCPIVWGNRVYLTTAVSESEEASGFQTGLTGDVASVDEDDPCSFRVLCLDLENGEVIWDEEATKAVPAVKRHAKSSHANPTPATDGRYIVACFGSEGIFCYDRDGKLQWERDLGLLDGGWFYDRNYQWGFGSSPIIAGERVFLQCDIQDESFLIALDLQSGETLWKVQRDEIPTWGTPVAYNAPNGTPVVVVSGTKMNAAYRQDDGTLLWSLGGFSEIVAPTPQVTPWGVLLSSGYAPVRPIAVVKHEARGGLELPESDSGKIAGPTENFVWSRSRGGPYMSTPLIHDGLAYVCDTAGILTCYDAVNGAQLYKKRVRGDGANSFTGSPVASSSHLYLPSEQGVIQIVGLGPEFEKMDAMEIGEATLSTPAIAEGYLLIRGEKHLFAFREGIDADNDEPIDD
ncbi:MAG: PQQ-binding-like beta-propeller repeat protein [Planctomycetota bacterium]